MCKAVISILVAFLLSTPLYAGGETSGAGWRQYFKKCLIEIIQVELDRIFNHRYFAQIDESVYIETSDGRVFEVMPPENKHTMTMRQEEKFLRAVDINTQKSILIEIIPADIPEEDELEE